MIQLHIREHGTHNNGWSFDFKADLNDYTDSGKLLEDVWEYTRKCIQEHELTYEDEMEEYLITDWEFEEDFKVDINEYSSLQRLIDINTKVKVLEKVELKLITALGENGWDFKESIEKINDGDIRYFEGSLGDWILEMIDEGLFGEISETLKPFLNINDMEFALGVNDGYYEYDDDLSYCAY